MHENRRRSKPSVDQETARYSEQAAAMTNTVRQLRNIGLTEINAGEGRLKTGLANDYGSNGLPYTRDNR